MKTKMKNMITIIIRRAGLLLENIKSSSKTSTVFLGLIVIILFSSTCILAFNNNNLRKELTDSKTKYDKLASNYTKLYKVGTGLYSEYQVIEYNYSQDAETYEKLNSEIKDLMDTVTELDSQNKKLAKENKQMHSDLDKYEKRSELFDKYEYAVYNGKKRTSFTYSQLQLAEDIMEEKGMDANLLLAIAMTESGGNEKIQSKISTARGYGQFLSGTGKFVYEDLMNAGTYNHNYALNGSTNIKLMANYLKYLQGTRSNIYGIIESYRGVKNCTGYMNKVNSYLVQGGTSLEKINKKIYP
jgi:hypothetical protein